MKAPHRQWEWNAEIEDDLRHLMRLAIREDIDRFCDLTSFALLSPSQTGQAVIRARAVGVVSGAIGVGVLIDEFHASCRWKAEIGDGDSCQPDDVIGRLEGSARDLLAIERPLLNYLSHLSGIASLTRKFVEAVEGTSAVILDTRKTVPGWRRLAKYAIRCGGGTNHRTGLFDAILIKDNHLAALAENRGGDSSISDAVASARRKADRMASESGLPSPIPIEIEIDEVAQLEAALQAEPDMILLDNFALEQLTAAVAARNENHPKIQLEASGGVQLDTVRAIAMTGVDRISVGQLTHSAPALDLAVDWDWRV